MDQSLHCACFVGRDSSVGIAARYVLYDSEDRIPMGVRFSDVHTSDDNEWICSIAETVTDRREQIRLSATMSTQIANTGLRCQKRGDVRNSLARKFPASYVI